MEQHLISDPRFKPYESQLTYIDHDGKIKRTKEKFTIATIHFIALEKLGVFENAAGASCTLNYTGGPARPMTNKGFIPDSPNRVFGEDEMRTACANTAKPIYNAQGQFVGMDKTGSETAREYLMHAVPALHAKVARAILTAEKPSNIEEIVTDEELKEYDPFPHQLVDSINMLGGLKIERK